MKPMRLTRAFKRKIQKVVSLAMAMVLVTTSCPAVPVAYGEDAADHENIELVLADETTDDQDAIQLVDGDSDDEETISEGVADEASSPETPEDEGEPEAQSLESVTLKNNESGTIAAGQVHEGNLTFDKAGTYTLTVDGTMNGHVVVKNGAKLTVNGDGRIDALGTEGSVIEVTANTASTNGTFLRVEGTVEITGGTGSLVEKSWVGYRAGGGILVKRPSSHAWNKGGARLELAGGRITHNTAEAGGGVFVDVYCGFSMTGGEVTHNTATLHEGGGIFFAGNVDGQDGYPQATAGEIISGTISDNVSKTTTDWGGGGVYVNNDSTMKIGIARITDNTAYGLGGGVAGCPHANIGIGNITNGAPIYGNTALKQNQPQNSALNSLTSKRPGYGLAGDMYAYGNAHFTDNAKWSMDEFTADKAMDYYCTEVSYVFGYDLGQEGDAAWVGYQAGSTGGFDVTIAKGEPYVADDASLGLTNTQTEDYADADSFDVLIERNVSHGHGGGIGCNGDLAIGKLENADLYGKLNFDLAKELRSTLGDSIALKGGEFEFELLSADGSAVLASATNDENGLVSFSVDAKEYLEGKGNGSAFSASFMLREVVDDSQTSIAFDTHLYKVTIGGKAQVKSYNDKAFGVTVTSHNVDQKEGLSIQLQQVPCDDATCQDNIDGGLVGADGAILAGDDTLIDLGTRKTAADDYRPFTITNTLDIHTTASLVAEKSFWGDESERFDFQLQEMEPVADTANVDLTTTKPDGFAMVAQNGAYDGDGKAPIEFRDILFSEPGQYWFRINEVAEDGTGDGIVYVVSYEVALNDAKTELSCRQTGLWYAEDLSDTSLTAFSGTPSFYNTQGIVLGEYRANAATDEALERTCLVDPKIHKELDGRTLKDGEFSFKLVQATTDYAPTGVVISETANDRYGMVDFDAANNLAPDGMDPCCLVFTSPGTYRYVVIEDPTVTPDPTVQYDTTTITFTVVIAEEADGSLVCTSMYYGHLVDGENVRYEESVDPNWHPTLTNRVKGMDLKVRKTSTIDRELGLEGATYVLYAVSGEGQADRVVAEGVSDADGWVTYKDVALDLGTKYYFRETDTPPEGYTISAFRSQYFELAVDATAPGGYVLRYDLDDNPELSDMEFGSAQTSELAALDAELDGEASDGDETSDHGTFADDGNLVLVYDHDGGVSDAPTHLEFTKLDGRTHEWIEGAHLALIDKESGVTITEWVSGDAPEVLDGVLTVGRTYILRELEAPEGYALADDVEFVLDNLGKAEILSGDGVLDEVQERNAELSDETLVLYNTMYNGEEVLTETRERIVEVPGEDRVEERYGTPGDSTTETSTGQGGSSGTLPTTGDPALDLTILVAAAASLGGVGVVIGRRRRNARH